MKLVAIYPLSAENKSKSLDAANDWKKIIYLKLNSKQQIMYGSEANW